MRQPRSGCFHAIFVITAGLMLLGERSHAGPEADPNPLPIIVACHGGSMGVARSGATRSCYGEQSAYWFYAVEPHRSSQLSDVMYRFAKGAQQTSKRPATSAI